MKAKALYLAGKASSTRPSELMGLCQMYGQADHRCLDFDLWVTTIGLEWESEEMKRSQQSTPEDGPQRSSRSKSPVTNMINSNGKLTGAVFLPGAED